MVKSSKTIKEIFGPTIQGEGSYSGMPCMFVRFAGCNRNCSFCDTDWKDGVKISDEMILYKLKELLPKDKELPIVFTGGEPTLQLDYALLTLLANNGFNTCHIETNGSNSIDVETESLIDWIVMSPKQSLSETKLEDPNDIKILYPYQDYIGDINEWIQSYKAASFFIQPIWGPDFMRNLKEAQREVARLKMDWKHGPSICLGLQTHKFIGAR